MLLMIKKIFMSKILTPLLFLSPIPILLIVMHVYYNYDLSISNYDTTDFIINLTGGLVIFILFLLNSSYKYLNDFVLSICALHTALVFSIDKSSKWALEPSVELFNDSKLIFIFTSIKITLMINCALGKILITGTEFIFQRKKEETKKPREYLISPAFYFISNIFKKLKNKEKCKNDIDI